MSWIFVMMLAMIVGSILTEWLVPARVKQFVGVAACWMMMTITMTFLGMATIALILVVVDNYAYDFSFINL